MIINVSYNKGIEENNREKKFLERAIKAINGVQNYFAFILSNSCSDDLGSLNNSSVDWDAVSKVLRNSKRECAEVFVTDRPFVDNWFSHEESDFSILSIYDWEQSFAPPSLEVYIIFQLAQAAMCFTADLSEELALNMTHYPSKGCMFDMCYDKSDIKLGMIGGAICSECKGLLRQYGVQDRPIEAIEKILSYVRNIAIGQPVQLADNTAFVVMRFTHNDENDHAYEYGIKGALEELGINCDRADKTLQSGPLLHKIIQSIRRSRYIIAKVDQDNLNVFYELGLAMGLEKDVILIAEQELVLNLPSDLKNWECITYKKGDYNGLKSNIIRFFKDNYEYINI